MGARISELVDDISSREMAAGMVARAMGTPSSPRWRQSMVSGCQTVGSPQVALSPVVAYQRGQFVAASHVSKISTAEK